LAEKQFAPDTVAESIVLTSSRSYLLPVATLPRTTLRRASKFFALGPGLTIFSGSGITPIPVMSWWYTRFRSMTSLTPPATRIPFPVAVVAMSIAAVWALLLRVDGVPDDGQAPLGRERLLGAAVGDDPGPVVVER